MLLHEIPLDDIRAPTLVEHAWTFYMYFNVASNFCYDNLNILRKL